MFLTLEWFVRMRSDAHAADGKRNAGARASGPGGICGIGRAEPAAAAVWLVPRHT